MSRLAIFTLSGGSRRAAVVCSAVCIAAVLAAPYVSAELIWALADVSNGLMAFPNLIALIGLSPVIKKLTVDLFSDPDRIRPRGTDFSKLLTFRGKR